MKKILIILLFLSSIGKTFAQDSLNVILYFDSINKNISLGSLTREEINHILIQENKDKWVYLEHNSNLYIHIDYNPTIKYYNNTIETHLNTLFINGQGIGLHKSVYLQKDGKFSFDN